MKLRDYLEETGIPTTRLARRCKITYAKLNHILGGGVPTLKTACELDKYTEGKVSFKDLLDEETVKAIYGEED